MAGARNRAHQCGHGDEASCAHLLEFDSVHGRWQRDITATADTLTIDNQVLSHSSYASPDEIDWEQLGVDVVLEATGRFKTLATLQPHFDRGARMVVVAAPVHDPAAINVVVGINDDQYDPALHDIATAASCTTNCLAPIVQTIH